MSILDKVLITTTALSLSACLVKQDAPPSSIDRAIPTADEVSIKLPTGTNRTVGQLADFYVTTRGITTTFNGGSAWVLVLIHAIVQTPPTSVDGNVYTWGPGSNALDPADYRLDVTDNGDDTYDWALSGRSKTEANAQFEVLIDGFADSTAGEGQGNGNFKIDFDAGRRVNPIDADPNARGQVTVGYDLAARHLDLHIDSTDDNGSPIDADYAYEETADGGGSMLFSVVGDMGGGPAAEQALIHSRWETTGAGRADVALKGGDTENPAGVLASECWDTQFKRSYFAVLAGDTNGTFGATEGDEASCVFANPSMPGQ